MWKWLFNIIKSLLFSILIYWIFLFLLHQYTDWFWVEEVKEGYDVFLVFVFLSILFWLTQNIVKWVLKFLSLPLTYLTFGSFTLVLNVVLLYVFEYIVDWLGLWIVVHISDNIGKVILMSFASSIIAFLIKKIKL